MGQGRFCKFQCPAVKLLIEPEASQELDGKLQGLENLFAHNSQQPFNQKYCVTHQSMKKISYGFWDNQWFGRNQIYLK
jgi:hypothetical protein